MSSTNVVSITAPRTNRPRHSGIARIAVAAAILVGGARAADAQTALVTPMPAPRPAAWEFRVSSGVLVPTGAQRDVLKDAPLTVAQLTYVVRRPLAITGSFGWARSHDLAVVAAPKVDVFTYDLGAEARAPQWRTGHAVTFTPFAGGGIGGRSYNYRSLDVDATRNGTAYGAVGGEIGLRRVHLRLEVRDYVGGFKPLAGGGHGDTRNDVVMMAGLRVSRR